MNDKYFGSHEIQVREEVIKGSSDRSFGMIFAAFFAIVSAISWYYAGAHWTWWFTGAVVFALVALISPRLLGPLNRLWMKFGLLLALIISPIALGLIFYLCITPIGLVMRLFGKDPLRLRFDRQAETYWIPREPPGPPAESLKNQF